MEYNSQQVTRMLNHPAIKRRVAQRVRINHKHDVPGLAACSKNGKTVYIDRKLSPIFYKNVRNYAVIKKALIDLFHLSPFFASDFAARVTLNVPRNNPLPIPKSANSPEIKNPPPDLDLSGFRVHSARIIRRRIKQKRLDKTNRLAYNEKNGVKNDNRAIHQTGLSRLSKN